MIAPFFILGTPRSRTAWLAEFLSVPGRRCEHEPSARVADWPSLREMLSRPGMAASDSLLTFRWRAVVSNCPDARIVVVRRPLDQVADSFRRIGISHVEVMPLLHRLDQAVRAMLAEVPALSVPYDVLDRRKTCAAIWRHCHGSEMPPGHWEAWRDRNVQVDLQTALAALNRDGMRTVFPETMEAA